LDLAVLCRYRGVANVITHMSHSPQPAVVVTPGRIFMQEGEMTLIEKKKKRKVYIHLIPT